MTPKKQQKQKQRKARTWSAFLLVSNGSTWERLERIKYNAQALAFANNWGVVEVLVTEVLKKERGK